MRRIRSKRICRQSGAVEDIWLGSFVPSKPHSSRLSHRRRRDNHFVSNNPRFSFDELSIRTRDGKPRQSAAAFLHKTAICMIESDDRLAMLKLR